MRKLFSRPVVLIAPILLAASLGLAGCATDGSSNNNYRTSDSRLGSGLSGYSNFGRSSGYSNFGRSSYGRSGYNGGLRGYSRFGGYNRGYGGYGGGYGRGYGGYSRFGRY